MKHITIENGFKQVVFSINIEIHDLMLDFMLKLSHFYSSLFVSQSYLADKFGLCREQVNRIIGNWCRMGLLLKYRRFNATCVYKMNPLFYSLAHQLWYKFPSLKQLSKRTLETTLEAIYTPNVTLSLKGIYNNTKFDALVAHVNNQETQNPFSRDHDSRYDHDYFLKITKKEEKMVESVSNAVNRAIDNLGLTELGIAKTSVLSDRAIDYALSKGPYTYFAKFFDCGVSYSKENNLPLTWTNFYSYANTHSFDGKPVFMVSSFKVVVKKVDNGQSTGISYQEKLTQYREYRKVYYDKLIKSRPDLNAIALELQSFGFVAGIPQPNEPIQSSFDDSPPLTPDQSDNDVDYVLTVLP